MSVEKMQQEDEIIQSLTRKTGQIQYKTACIVVKILLHSMRVTKMIGEALFSAWPRGKFSLGREQMRPPALFGREKEKSLQNQRE